jgi:hypothetical protein
MCLLQRVKNQCPHSDLRGHLQHMSKNGGYHALCKLVILSCRILRIDLSYNFFRLK